MTLHRSFTCATGWQVNAKGWEKPTDTTPLPNTLAFSRCAVQLAALQLG
jgi:hypothetical protein